MTHAPMVEIVDRVSWGADPPRWDYHPIDPYQSTLILHHAAGSLASDDDIVSLNDLRRIRGIPVSYTHLTLPTKRIV